MNYRGFEIDEAAFAQRLEGMKNGCHRHLCSFCRTLWQHTGAEITDRHKAHCCPVCGEYNPEIFFYASESYAIEWDGTRESASAKLFDLRRRDEFEQTKIRRIYFRVYWLVNKKV